MKPTLVNKLNCCSKSQLCARTRKQDKQKTIRTNNPTIQDTRLPVC